MISWRIAFCSSCESSLSLVFVLSSQQQAIPSLPPKHKLSQSSSLKPHLQQLLKQSLTDNRKLTNMQYGLDPPNPLNHPEHSSSSLSPDSSTARGLHTLVDGLAIDDSTHATNSSSGASPTPASERPPSILPLFAHAASSSASPANSSSIFNNPQSIAGPSSSSPSSAGPQTERFSPPSNNSGAGPSTPANTSRVGIYDVGSRRPTFLTPLAPSNSSRSNGKAVKEVDDPTSTPAYGDRHLATPQTLGRLYTSQPSPIQMPQHKVTSYRGLDSVRLEDFLYNRGFVSNLAEKRCNG